MSVLERVREQEVLAEREEPRASLSEARRRLKRGVVDRIGLATVARMVGEGDLARMRQELGIAAEALLNGPGFAEVAPQEHERLVREVLDGILGLGPIQPLLDDPSISEVMVNGVGSLFYERAGTLVQAERAFETSEQILTVVDRIIAPLGRRLDERNPIVNARLANGDRVNAVIAPVAIDGPAVTIRKFSSRIATMRELVELGSVPEWYAQLLAWAVRMHKDIAVAGGTGSGKTTLLNALSCEIGPDERIVTIEDSAELRFDAHPHVVRLEARDASIEGVGEVSIRDLVKNALRMRPDRIVVGEVRGGECIDMLQAMNTGHDGSLTTLHAGSEREAVLRLVLMARFGMDLPTDIVEEQIASGLDLIVMSRRMPDGRRVISSTSAVGKGEAGGVQLEELVSFDPAARTWHLEREPGFLEEAVEMGLISEGRLAQWRESCS